MPRRNLTTALAFALVLAACSSGGSSGGGRIRSLLGLAPATGDYRTQVTVVDLAAARNLADIAQPPHDAEIGDYRKLFFAPDAVVQALTPGTFQSRSADIDKWRNETGFSLLDVDAAIDAGEQPHVISVVLGRIDKAEVSAALKSSFGPDATERDRDGEHIVSVGADDTLDVTRITAARPIGESVRAAIDDGSVRWVRSDTDLDAAIDVAHGGRSLMDDKGFRAAADALDRERAYQAVFLAQPKSFGIDAVLGTSNMSPSQAAAARTQLQASALRPWRIAAIGDAVVDGHAEGVLVLVHADADAAKANADRLRMTLTSGTDPTAGRPYSDQMSSVEVRADDDVVIATMHLERPGYLIRLLGQRGLPLTIG